MRSSHLPRRLPPLSAVVRALGWTLGAWCVAGLAFSLVFSAGCRPQNSDTTSPSSTPATLALDSHSCRACHEEIFRQWQDSDHAHAHRPVDGALDEAAFRIQPDAAATPGVEGYRVGWQDAHPFIETHPEGQAPTRHPVDFILARRPLWQPIVPTSSGRYQAADLAFDPAKKEWFNVFGGEGREPGEWGHWLGRGMNWNSMCAHCHMTNYRKNYDAATDTYASTWQEHGVGCVQCHGNLTSDHAKPGYRTLPPLAEQFADRRTLQETCAPCHARNELLTREPRPGMAYHDHFRVALPVSPREFYPDGQVRDEDFNWTSLLLSRMGGKAGVTCLDCHEPHGGTLRVSSENNAICLQCHSPGNVRNAPVVDPTAHSHHRADSTGNQCVACHMPTTTYMQRDPRHDHGFLAPDPLLTKELGIPNACGRCHEDKGVDWQVEWTDRWYGAKMNSRQRERTRAVDAAQKNHPDSAALLLGQYTKEDIPAWRATLLQLLVPHAADPTVRAASEKALHDAEPLVRAAAVQVLTNVPEARNQLRPLLQDPVRLVRLDAAWALSPELAADSPQRGELDAYFSVSADQPAGRLRLGQDLANRGRLAEAEAAMRQALTWDAQSPGFYSNLGLLLSTTGRDAEAAALLWRGAQLDAGNAHAAFEAALAFAGAGKLADAEHALRETVRRDPRFDRAWYNLGLLLSQTGDAAAALEALTRAEAVAPTVGDYPYARATVLWQLGRRPEAQEAARRALQLDPTNQRARAMLQN